MSPPLATISPDFSSQTGMGCAVSGRPLQVQRSLPVGGSKPARRFWNETTNSSCPPAWTTSGVDHDPDGPVGPPKALGPRGGGALGGGGSGVGPPRGWVSLNGGL